jgi:hypothetical protein
MIRVDLAKEPPDFDDEVRKKGMNALLELIHSPEAPTRRGPKRNKGKKAADRIEDLPVDLLPNEWTKALKALRESYKHTCAYLGMRIDPATGLATVDHFKPKSKHQRLAYEWSNFRLAAHQLNVDKGDHEDVLDPFAIQHGWFVLDLLTFEVGPAEELDPATRDKVMATRDRLKLNEATYCEARARSHDLYLGLKTAPDDPDEPLPLAWLLQECPFVAHELRRQQRLRPGDTFP